MQKYICNNCLCPTVTTNLNPSILGSLIRLEFLEKKKKKVYAKHLSQLVSDMVFVYFYNN